VLIITPWVKATPAEGVIHLRAVEAFSPVDEPGFVPPYAETRSPDASEHGLAVNTRRFNDKPAAAELVFHGVPGVYDLTLVAVAEEDGESRYALVVNGTPHALKTNPPSPVKRRPFRHTWLGIALQEGDRIRIIFQGHSNGQVPEGDGFAWSRGRWRTLEVAPTDLAQGAAPPSP
jgi:hypothetical protein